MIESIEFRNFKILRETTLPLGPCTILVGPNGSGKSTVLEGLKVARDGFTGDFDRLFSLETSPEAPAHIELVLNWGDLDQRARLIAKWPHHGRSSKGFEFPDGMADADLARIHWTVPRIRIYSLDARAIAPPAPVAGSPELQENGAGLAAVLDGIRDMDIGRFNAINAELQHWLPEFSEILFDRPSDGHKSVVLKTRDGKHKVPAADLSQGTLIALALLTLAYLPEPPSLIALEEPDRGIHPRLLRRVQDALYRLSYPESCGEDRQPVQVIATTHSPYFLDLFKDHPEEIVLANKTGQDVKFERLSERDEIEEILGTAPLGEAWYSGILGGVPSEP